VLNPDVTLYQMRAIKMSVKVESNSWMIETKGGTLGPLTSYALALWAVQGLLYPNDILVHNHHSRARAGALEILHPFIRNNGHLNRAKVWTFASGKGGVGKSLLSALLGIVLSMKGRKVVIVDGDFDGANQHELFNIQKKTPNYWYWLDKKQPLKSLALPTGFDNLRLVQGPPSDKGEPSSLSNKIKFISALRSLDADVVLLDLGPRMEYEYLDYFVMADNNIVVTTPEPTALQNTTAFMKSIFKRKLETAAQTLLGKKHPFQLDIQQNESSILQRSIELLNQVSLPVTDLIYRSVASLNAKVVFNMVDSQTSAPVKQLKKYVRRDVGILIDHAGNVRFDPAVRAALQKRHLGELVMTFQPIVQDIHHVSGALLQGPNVKQADLRTFTKPLQKATKDVMCGTWCDSWRDCRFKTPGYPCAVRNMN
jgi:flagellar biosynthesis protein FlhG